MRHFMTSALICAGLSLPAAPALAMNSLTLVAGQHPAVSVPADATIWLAKGKGNGGKAKGKARKQAKVNGHRGKPQHAGKRDTKPAKARQAASRDDKGGNRGKPDFARKDDDRRDDRKIDRSDRRERLAARDQRDLRDLRDQRDGRRTVFRRVNRDDDRFRGNRDSWARQILQVRAPRDRDMATIIGTTALALAGPSLLVAETPVDRLITYRNCPPGLAKKTPACVPPGLARGGISQEDWFAYDDGDYDRLWLRERDRYLRDGVVPDNSLLLRSEEIARLFGLDPAPRGQRYGLIDGMPVLLDQEDYDGLLLINDLARVADIGPNLNVAPTAALTQDELRRLYRLPPLQPDQNYAVLNGQIVSLDDSEYQTLQLIRIARAIF